MLPSNVLGAAACEAGGLQHQWAGHFLFFTTTLVKTLYALDKECHSKGPVDC